MSWAIAALLNAVLSGLANVFESHLIVKRMPSLQAFQLPAGILQFGLGLLFLGLFPLPMHVGIVPWLVAAGSGVAAASGFSLMLRVFRTEEVSRIIPVVYTYPVFVAILAFPLLGEAVSSLEWLAIFMTVAGVVLMSVRLGDGARNAQWSRNLALLLGASFLWALSSIGSKYALRYISFNNMYSINALSIGALFMLTSLRPSVLRQLGSMKHRRLSLGMLLVTEALFLPSALFFFWALQKGPVSLVSTISATRPCLVFLYTLVLAYIFPNMLRERLTMGSTGAKIISIGLITGGVAIINLR